MQFKSPAKSILFFLRLCLSCAIVIYLISLLDIDRLFYVIHRLKIHYAWQAFFFVLATYLTVAIRWSLLLGHFNIQQRIGDSWRYYMIGGFYNIIFPGIIGEDVVRLSLSLKSHSKSKTLLVTSILFERSCGIVALFLMAFIAALFVPILLEGEHTLSNLIVGVALGVFFCFIIFFIALKLAPSSWLNNHPSSSLGNWKQKIIVLLGYFRDLPFTTIFIFLLLSMVAHLLDIAGTFYLSRALHIDQSFFIFLLIMPLVFVLTILPISIGGIGVREGILTFFLVKVGVMASDAVLLAFTIYINRILVSLIGGMMQFMDKRNSSSHK